LTPPWCILVETSWARLTLEDFGIQSFDIHDEVVSRTMLVISAREIRIDLVV
jgi:hypothetical protein